MTLYALGRFNYPDASLDICRQSKRRFQNCLRAYARPHSRLFPFVASLDATGSYSVEPYCLPPPLCPPSPRPRVKLHEVLHVDLDEIKRRRERNETICLDYFTFCFFLCLALLFPFFSLPCFIMAAGLVS